MEDNFDWLTARDRIKDKNILVTGGCGFVGSHLAEVLSRENQVTILDNLSSGSLQNIRDFRKRIKLVKADVRETRKVKACLNKTDIVFHTAASVEVNRSVKEPLQDSEVNVLGTINLLEASKKVSVEKFIYSSSCAVYGNPAETPLKETSPAIPISPYGLSKLSAEMYCRLYSSLHNLYTISLRYFNIYGPKQRSDSPYSGVISLFSKFANEGKTLPIHGSGNQTRDFINIRDIVKANILAANSTKLSGEVFNIGTGKAITINSLAKIIQLVSGKKLRLSYQKPRKGDIQKSVADITKARERLKFQPTVSLEQGLKELI